MATRCLAALLLCTLWTTPLGAAEVEPGALIERAVETYQSALDADDRDVRVQRFRRAEALFSRVIEQQLAQNPQHSVSADLYVNLGNAALGAERLGPAIIAYRRALVMDPQHRRATENLRHARTLLPDWVPTPEDPIALGSFFDWARGLGRADGFGLAALAFFVTAILGSVYLRTEKPIARNGALLCAVLWIATLAGVLLEPDQASVSEAVVVAAEVSARAADSINAPVRFTEPLPGGSEIQITEDREAWIRVRLYDSREAWLPASAIERVGRSGL
jgi:tetratricopeptide (TPR) repeat protein